LSDAAEFFLGSAPSVARYDCLEISHPNFGQTYRLVRNAPAGISVTHAGEPVLDWVFDGVDDEVSFGDVLDMTRTTPRSMFCWYVNNGVSQTILAKQSAANQIGWRWVISSDDTEDFIIAGAGAAQQIQVGCTPRPTTDGALHNFGFTYDGSSAASGFIFYNDAVAGSNNVGTDNLTSASTENSEPLQMGRRGSTAPFDGRLRHLSVWNRVLTPTEVEAVYGDGVTPPDLALLSFFSDCILWIKLDTGDSAAAAGVIDHGPDGHNGTANFDPLVVTDAEFEYEYCPARVLPIASEDDLVQSLSVTLGDVGEIIAAEIANVWAANGMDTRPTLTYRAFRSDDLSTPIEGSERVLEIAGLSRSREGCSFEARAPEINASRTGELYTVERFPMLAGFQ
jgi:hypothetical protein